jgi:hypothetical protein
MNLPDYMMEMLRGRRGLEPGDKSQDADIGRLSPVDVVRECVAWRIGDPNWATEIALFMDHAGANPKDFI